MALPADPKFGFLGPFGIDGIFGGAAATGAGAGAGAASGAGAGAASGANWNGNKVYVNLGIRWQCTLIA